MTEKIENPNKNSRQDIYWFTQIIGFRKTPVNEKIPELNLPGWVTDLDQIVDHKLYDFVYPCSIPVAPAEHYFPFGDAHKASLQLRKWRHELGGTEIIPLLVHDSQQENLWLFQPVKIDDLRQSLDSLIAEYQNSSPNDLPSLRLRATIIAKTGYQPEKLLKKKREIIF